MNSGANADEQVTDNTRTHRTVAVGLDTCKPPRKGRKSQYCHQDDGTRLLHLDGAEAISPHSRFLYGVMAYLSTE